MSNKISFRLPITLTPAQTEIDRSQARFKVVKAGRRFGKTRLGAKWLCHRALTKPGKHWYVAPALGLARDEMYPAIMDLLPPETIKRADDRNLTVVVNNGIFSSFISCKSGEKETNLRGRGLASVAIDEAAFLRATIWPEVLRPQLADLRGDALIFSTPKKGWFTRLYRQAASGYDRDWAAFHFTIYDSWMAQTPDGLKEIEEIRRTTPEHVWSQEYMAEEVARAGQVYEEFAPEFNIFNPATQFLDYKNWPCVGGIDWGSHADTAVSWISINPHGHLIITREHSQKGWDVQRHAETMKRLGAGLSIAAYDYVLDRSAFRQEATSQTSIADQFKKNDIHCARSEKDVNASIDLVKRYLRGDARVPWLYVSKDCPKTIEALNEWEHEQHEPDILAALRYGVVHAVRRGYTKLAEAPREDLGPMDDLRAEIEFRRAPYLSPIFKAAKKGASQWTWDPQAGTP